MLYSKSAEYAIRAFVHLAQVPEGKFAMVKNIAKAGRDPNPLPGEDSAAARPQGAAALEQRAHRRLRPAHEGGGYLLEGYRAKPWMGSATTRNAPAAWPSATTRQPCGMHDAWTALRSRILDYLEQTTIADITAGPGAKTRGACRKPKRRKSRRQPREEETAGLLKWPARWTNNGQCCPGPHGGRTDLAGRARLRHLLAAAEREHHLSGHADRRQRRQSGDRPDAVSGGGGSREGHLALHQLARRFDHRRAGDPGHA